MRQFIRSPLTWMVVAELVVVGVLVVVAWTAVTAATRPALASPTDQLPDSPSDSSALPDLPVLTPGARGPLPGLNLESRFWRTRLAELNRDQALLAQLEWRIVHTAMDAMKRYLETVVLPAVQRAEKSGG
ncbi:MAG: hypothetical protein E6I67_01115 [Chloroflexi bacterium]|nr:MAG: hypothetical protein E6I67_01115 [Chloroflexota bacterium]